MDKLWNSIIDVPHKTPEEEQLGHCVAIISALGIVFFAILSVLVTTGSQSIFLVLVILFVTMYSLNRTGRYGLAAVGLMGTFAVMPFIFILLNGSDPALLGLCTMLAALSVGLSLLLLPTQKRRVPITLSLGLIVAFLLLPALHSGYRAADVLYPLIGLAGLGLVAVTYQKFQTQRANGQVMDLEATIKTLKETNTKLELVNANLVRKAQDFAVELDATVDEFLRAKDETEAAKAEAEHANNVKSAFLASMSHELRTPLNAIINFTKFVVKGSMGPVNDEQTETLNEVVASAKHLLSLINDVLDMSKIESGSLKLFVENNVELKPMLASILATGKILLADKPVTLQTDIDEDLPKIRGDQQRIFQILLNIISNACKFTKEGRIKLTVHQKDAEILFAVEDTGPGIALEDQASVFQAFKQTPTGLRQGGGTGLGMPISKNLAEAHGGRLWLESEPGKGSTFFVALPVKSEALTPISA